MKLVGKLTKEELERGLRRDRRKDDDNDPNDQPLRRQCGAPCDLR